MKHLVLAFLSTIAFAQAHAESGLQAELNQFTFDSNSSLANLDIRYGYVQIRMEEKVIQVTLQPAFHCPAGQFCPQVMPMPVVLRVPLQKVSIGHCGETRYIGSVDMRPVDGPRQQIEVIDNSTMTCKTFIAVPPTEVIYDFQTLRTEYSSRSLFIGQTLKPFSFEN